MYMRRYELRIGQNLSAAYTRNIRENYDPSSAYSGEVTTTPSDSPQTVQGPLFRDVSQDDITRQVDPSQQALDQFYNAGEIFENWIQTFSYDIDDLLSYGDNRIFISENHIKFEVEKTGKDASEGNTGEITIFNLSDDSAYLIENLSGIENFIELRAGYEDEDLKTIFRGNVQDVEDKFDGKERRTKITLTDGGSFIQNQMTSRKYPSNTKVDKIVEDLLSDLALDRGYIEKLGDDAVIRKPLVVHGKAAGELARILEAFNYQFNVQDMFSYVVHSRIDAVVGQSERFPNIDPRQGIPRIPLVNYNTGLLETPSFKSETSDLSASETNEEATSGIKFKSLLNGEFLPNSIVQVDSVKGSGVYRIIKVTHMGSFRGDEWFSEVEAELAPFSIGNDSGGQNAEDEPDDTESSFSLNFTETVAPYLGSIISSSVAPDNDG